MATKRRANGDGSFHKDKAGRWHGIIELPGGKRIHRSAMTRSEVQRKIREVQVTRARGLPVTNQRLTVERYLNDWLELTVRPSVRPRTYDAYESHARFHLVPHLGQRALAQLSVTDVQRMMAALHGAGLSPATVQRVRATLRNALAQAVATELVVRNVAALAAPPKVEHRDVRAIDVTEAEVILTAVNDHRLAPFFQFALYTGLRLGELAGLRWQTDIDLEAGTLSLGEQLHRQRGRGFVRSKLKGGKATRVLVLPQVAIDALRRQRALQAQDRLLAGSNWHNHENLCFTTTRGTPLDSSNATRKLQALVKQAGLPPCGTHALRHAHATILLARGEQPHLVQHQLGHSDVRLTLGTYAHVTKGMSARAAETINDAFTGGGERRTAS